MNFFKKIFHSFALLIVKLLFGIPSIPFPNSTPLETVLKETSLSFKVFVLVDLQPSNSNRNMLIDILIDFLEFLEMIYLLLFQSYKYLPQLLQRTETRLQIEKAEEILHFLSFPKRK